MFYFVVISRRSWIGWLVLLVLQKKSKVSTKATTRTLSLRPNLVSRGSPEVGVVEEPPEEDEVGGVHQQGQLDVLASKRDFYHFFCRIRHAGNFIYITWSETLHSRPDCFIWITCGCRGGKLVIFGIAQMFSKRRQMQFCIPRVCMTRPHPGQTISMKNILSGQQGHKANCPSSKPPPNTRTPQDAFHIMFSVLDWWRDRSITILQKKSVREICVWVKYVEEKNLTQKLTRHPVTIWMSCMAVITMEMPRGTRNLKTMVSRKCAELLNFKKKSKTHNNYLSALKA